MEHRETSSQPSHSHDTPLQRFGAILRQYRQQQRLSQRALAAKMGWRDRYLSQIELGRHNIAVLTLIRLASALDIPVSCLLAPLDPHAPLSPCASLSARTTLEVTPLGEPSIMLQRLGAVLRHARQQLRLSQPELAARTGLNPTYLGQIEHGHRNLSILSLVRIAKALELPVSSLLTRVDTPVHPSSSYMS